MKRLALERRKSFSLYVKSPSKSTRGAVYLEQVVNPTPLRASRSQDAKRCRAAHRYRGTIVTTLERIGRETSNLFDGD